MWKENLYQPVEVLTRKHTKFPIDEHQHSFFEMVFIRSGKGSFYVKEAGCKVQEITYEAHTLLLIPPDTVHRITTDSESEYIFIRFTPHYAANYMGKQVEQALYVSIRQCMITLCDKDKKTVLSLLDFIEKETCEKRALSNYLLQQWINSILAIVAHHFLQETSAQHIDTTNESDKAMYMLQYIQQHIDQPELLKTEALCKTFHMSNNYVGHYFKRHFQESLRDYITKNRIKMVENLLANTTLSVKEISARMNYTDSCYLVKTFRAHYGMSPLEFRKRMINMLN